MKNFKLVLGAAAIAASFASCKNEEKDTAEKNVDHYVVFVDSINSLDAAERSANWAAIEAAYQARAAEAEAALATLENDAKAQERINETKSKYDGVKTAAEADAKAKMEKEAAAANPAPATGGSMADMYFGAGNVVGSDMKFARVDHTQVFGPYHAVSLRLRLERPQVSSPYRPPPQFKLSKDLVHIIPSPNTATWNIPKSCQQKKRISSQPSEVSQARM